LVSCESMERLAYMATLSLTFSRGGGVCSRIFRTVVVSVLLVEVVFLHDFEPSGLVVFVVIESRSCNCAVSISCGDGCLTAGTSVQWAGR